MKYVALVFLLAGCASQSAHFVDRGLFNNTPFVTAKGKTVDEAKDLALKKMPSDFEIDREFASPVISCGLPGEAPVWDKPDRTVPARCPSGIYRVDVAVLPKSGAERDAILQTRQDGRDLMESSLNQREPAAE